MPVVRARPPGCRGMIAGLGRGQHVAAGLDGAGAQQRFPMRGAGDGAERGGNRQDLRARRGQGAIQMRKANVIADRQAQNAKGGLGQHGAVARADGRGFAKGLGLRDLHVEQVDLVIARGDLSVRPDQQRAIGKAPVWIVRLDQDRPGQHPDPGARRLIAQHRQNRVASLVGQDPMLMRAVHRNAIRDLGCQHESRACGHGLTQCGAQRCDVFGGTITHAGLQKGRAHPPNPPVSAAGPARHADPARAVRRCRR